MHETRIKAAFMTETYMKVAFMHEIFWNMHGTHTKIAFMHEMWWNMHVSGAPFRVGQDKLKHNIWKLQHCLLEVHVNAHAHILWSVCKGHTLWYMRGGSKRKFGGFWQTRPPWPLRLHIQCACLTYSSTHSAGLALQALYTEIWTLLVIANSKTYNGI